MTEYTYIDNNASLAACCRDWSGKPLLALDTEFIRTDTFYPIAGLLQANDGESSVLLDPLTIDDWQPLQALFRLETPFKLLHSCSEDLELFQCLLGELPTPLFDTQVGAGLAGLRPGMSYQNLLAETLGLEIPKGETRSDWLQRPLSDSQCHYAALDVEHLPALYNLLAERLEAQGRLHWWREDCDRIIAQARESLDPARYYQKIRAANRLDRRQQALLQALCQWREAEARRRNVPRGRIVKDPICVEIARRAPASLPALAALPEMPPQVVRRDGEQLLALVEAIQALAEDSLPEPLPEPLSREEAAGLKALQAEAQAVAQGLQIQPELLARKRDLEALIIARRCGQADLPAGLRGWREAVIGKNLLNVINL